MNKLEVRVKAWPVEISRAEMEAVCLLDKHMAEAIYEATAIKGNIGVDRSGPFVYAFVYISKEARDTACNNLRALGLRTVEKAKPEIGMLGSDFYGTGDIPAAEGAGAAGAEGAPDADQKPGQEQAAQGNE